MAKKKEEKITPEGIRKAMEQDKDKIEAALAAAVSNADGSHPPAPSVESPAPLKKDSEQSKVVQEERAVEEIEINAKDMFNVSNQNPDMNVRNHLRAINSRIQNEALKGGFSTNITFTVIQSDWVNIQHILDWYRARGFQIMGFEQSTPPYGKNAGTIQYNFTISWAVPT